VSSAGKEHAPAAGVEPGKSDFVDRSILRPAIEGHLVQLFKIVPTWITANFITLASFSVMWVLLFFAFKPGLAPELYLGVCIVCIYIYTMGDHLDGMQATATDTKSPLGKFLDHYCDALSGAIIIVGFARLVGVPAGPVLFGSLWLFFVAFVATYVEELENQRLVFGAVGSLEAIAVVLTFLLTFFFPPIRTFWMTAVIPGFPNYWSVILLANAGFAVTTIKIVARLRIPPAQFVLFAGCSLLLTVFLSFHEGVTDFQGWLALTLYGAVYLASVMRSQALGERHCYPDFPASFGVVVMCVLAWFQIASTGTIDLVLSGLCIYLALRVGFSLTAFAGKMKQHWRWLNPR